MDFDYFTVFPSREVHKIPSLLVPTALISGKYRAKDHHFRYMILSHDSIPPYFVLILFSAKGKGRGSLFSFFTMIPSRLSKMKLVKRKAQLLRLKVGPSFQNEDVKKETPLASWGDNPHMMPKGIVFSSMTW